MSNCIIYPGTFDPITNGHLDLIYRSSKLFDKIIVAISDNKSKRSFFSIEERKEIICCITSKYNKIEVYTFSELLVNIMHKMQVITILRGLRTILDFEYEKQLAITNKLMDQNIETLFLISTSKWAHVSSSLVKDIFLNGGDISSMVPDEVLKSFKKKKNNIF